MIFWLKAVLACMLACFVQVAAAQAAVPMSDARVTDETATLSQEQAQRLTEQLAGVELRTGAVMRVLIVSSLRGESVEGYAQRVFETWQPGQAGKDNGLLLVLAREERRMRIHTGRGLERFVSDAAAKQVTSGKMVPAFKAGNFYKGFTDAVTALESHIPAGTFTTSAPVQVLSQNFEPQPVATAPALAATLAPAAPVMPPALALTAFAIATVVGGFLMVRHSRAQRQKEARKRQLIKEDLERRQKESDRLAAEYLRREEARNARQAADAEETARAEKANLRHYALEAQDALRERRGSKPAARVSGSSTRQPAPTPAPAPGYRAYTPPTRSASRYSPAPSPSTHTHDDGTSYGMGYMAGSSQSRYSPAPSPSYHSSGSSDSFSGGGGGGSDGGGASDSY